VGKTQGALESIEEWLKSGFQRDGDSWSVKKGKGEERGNRKCEKRSMFSFWMGNQPAKGARGRDQQQFIPVLKEQKERAIGVLGG